MHISRLNGPPGFFYTHPHPNQMYSVNSPHSPPHENVIHSSLSSPHPISEPLSLTPLNRLNSTKHAYFQTQWPPWFLLYTPSPQPNVSSQLPTPSPTRKCYSFFSLFTPPNLWAFVLDPSRNVHVWYYFSDSEGSRTRAQRLGGVKREKNEWHFSYGRWVRGVDWIHWVEMVMCLKKPRRVIGSGNMHVWYYFKRFRGVKDKGSEIGWGEERKKWMTLLCGGRVWVVDWIPLVGVGVCIKKPREVIGSGNMHVWYYLSDSEGSRTKAQRLGGVKREKNEWHFRVGGRCAELTGYIWFG